MNIQVVFFSRFLYTDSITLSMENVTSILYCSRKYCVDKLTLSCEKFMENKIDAENVFGIMEEAHNFGLTNLRDKCVKFLVQNTKESLLSESFTYICRECVRTVLTMDSLSISEEMLFEHTLRWAEAECKRRNIPNTDRNKRHVLGDNVTLIRFPAMSSSYFQQKVASGEFLGADEVIDVFLHNFSKDDGESRVSTFFEVSSRSYQPVLRFRKTLRERQSTDDKNDIAFESSIPAILHGLCVYTPKEDSEIQVVSIEVFDHRKSSIASVDNHFFEHSERKIHDVFLPQAIRLVPNKRYTISTRNSYSVKSFYGSRGKQTVQFGKGVISFYNAALTETSDSEDDWNWYRANTTVDKGQIAGLLLS